MPSASTSSGILPTACAASLWKSTSRSRADARDLRERLERADLAVRRSDGDEHGARLDRLRDVGGIDAPLAVDRQQREARAAARERARGVEHRGVLGGDADEVVARLRVRRERALEREVVALGGAAREDDLARVARAERLGDPLARELDCGLGAPAVAVRATRGVAEVLAPVRRHGLDHARIDGGGGVVVEVDRLAGRLTQRTTARSRRIPWRSGSGS